MPFNVSCWCLLIIDHVKYKAGHISPWTKHNYSTCAELELFYWPLRWKNITLVAAWWISGVFCCVWNYRTITNTISFSLKGENESFLYIWTKQLNADNSFLKFCSSRHKGREQFSKDWQYRSEGEGSCLQQEVVILGVKRKQQKQVLCRVLDGWKTRWHDLLSSWVNPCPCCLLIYLCDDLRVGRKVPKGYI